MIPTDPPEWKEVEIGHGDGATKMFTTNLPWRPAVPDSLSIYVVPGSVLEKLIPLEDRPPFAFTKKKQPGPNDDIMLFNEVTCVLSLNFAKPPERNADLVVRYQWRPPRLRNCKVRVQFPDGHEEWVTMDELFDVPRGR